VQTQATELERIFVKEGWHDCGDYCDNNLSGSKTTVVRPEFERMLREIQSGAADVDLIVAYDISRLFRNRRDKLRLEALIEQGVHLYDLRYNIDTRDKVGRIVFGFMAEWAIDRAEEISEYQVAAARRRRQEGRPSFSVREAYGYAIHLASSGNGASRYEIVQHEAEMICWARDELLAGASYNSICKALNDQTGPHYRKPRRGKMWRPSNLKAVLTAARIAGCTEIATAWDFEGNPTDFELVPNRDGSLPAIITIDELLRIREVFKVSSLRFENGSNKGRTPLHLLSGLARCFYCDGPMYKQQSGGIEIYLCFDCGRLPRGERAGVVISISKRFLDEFVSGATIERIRSGAIADIINHAVGLPGIDSLASAINSEEARLREFLELTAENKVISPRAFIAFTENAERVIADLRAQMHSAIESSVTATAALLPGDIAEIVDAHWESADLEWRRRLIELCWERIIIHPSTRLGRSSDAQKVERVELVPRGYGRPELKPERGHETPAAGLDQAICDLDAAEHVEAAVPLR